MNQRNSHRKSHARGRLVAALSIAAGAVIGFGAAGAIVITLRPPSTTPADAISIPVPYQWPQQQVPIGITLSGLQNYLISGRTIRLMCNQIHAAKTFWYANTIRLQIEQDRLVGVKGTGFNHPYMWDIRAVARCALREHLTVVLNAQTEQTTGFGVNEHLPTHATRVFWQHMMQFYANNPRVVFDLFNEPRQCHWSAWHRTFQHLVNYIRKSARNQIWAEGLWWGSTLAGVHPLHGTGIVYSWHKPGAPWPYKMAVTVGTWNHAFGDFCNQNHACVDGEFGNYRGSYYWRHTRKVRKYLRYLAAHHIGMLAWTLTAGSLNKNQSFTSVSVEPQGDGAVVRRWFASMSRGVHP